MNRQRRLVIDMATSVIESVRQQVRIQVLVPVLLQMAGFAYCNLSYSSYSVAQVDRESIVTSGEIGIPFSYYYLGEGATSTGVMSEGYLLGNILSCSVALCFTVLVLDLWYARRYRSMFALLAAGAAIWGFLLVLVCVFGSSTGRINSRLFEIFLAYVFGSECVICLFMFLKWTHSRHAGRKEAEMECSG